MPASSQIKRLKTGNKNFISKYDGHIQKHVGGQKPFAAVLACSDSRVPPELIFDVGIGEIFVVRDAGNVAVSPYEIGSLEYAVEHLRVPLILVLGHTNCGALNAAENGPGDHSHIGDIVNEIRCCFGEKDHLRANIRMQMGHLVEKSPVISEAVRSGKVAIRGAVYHLEDGTVEFME